MRRLLYAAFVAVLVLTLWTIRPAGADHDQVYAPCDPEDTRPFDQRVWFIDYQSGDMLRWDDPWWGERPGVYTNWRHQCRLGMTGVWQAAPILPLPHPPTHTIESREAIRATTTTTTQAPATTTTVEAVVAGESEPPATTTTVPPTTTVAPPTTTTAATIDLGGGSELPDGYDLWDAEYDGWPFEQTIILLEDRYPPGTPDRFHFRLSAAVEFLRQGGMVGGLDFLWESG